uniref:glucuronosyltransferase n=1 Tax=Heterorhabditis bacteriophora TaxID=37862 RepID=A0A1I7XNP0_HETBA
MLADHRFIDYVNRQHTDVVVLDHFLQECIGAASYLLNASTVQFSNWPIADGYITSLNIPANPSATPKTGTPFTGLGMTFLQRVGNFLFHYLIVLTRYIQIHVLDNLLVRKGYPWVKVVASEAERIIYAGRSEFLFEVVRPINNRVKHFGATSCMDPSDYVIAMPSDMPMMLPVIADPTESFLLNSSIHNINEIGITCNSSGDYSDLQLSMSLGASRRPQLYQNLSFQTVQKRFDLISHQFPGIDWKLLGIKSFILVSFGSVAQVRALLYNTISYLTMLRSYRTLHQEDQRFWLRWTARNGQKLKHRRLFRLEYIGDGENYFWFSLAFLMYLSVFCLTQ